MGALRNSILVFFALSVEAAAGAWTQPRGNGQAILTTSYSFGVDAFDADGRLIRIEPLEKIEVRAFTEYGITDWATVFAQPEWRAKSQGDDSVDGFGRFDIGARARVWQDDPAVASIQGSIRIPGASDELSPLNGGDTEFEFDGRALYGRSFTVLGKPAFMDAQLGYRHRLGDPPDEVRFDFTAGVEIRDRTQTFVQSFNAISVGDADMPFGESQEHKLAVSSVYRLSDRWSVQVGGSATVYGKNALREQGFFAGLWARF